MLRRLWTVTVLSLVGLTLAACGRDADAADTAALLARHPEDKGAAVMADAGVDALPAELPDGFQPADDWLSAWLNDQKIGYQRRQLRAIERNGRTLLEFRSTENTSIALLGQQVQQVATSVFVCDTDWSPVESSVTMESNGRTTAIVSTYHPDRVDNAITSSENPETRSQAVPIPAGITLSIDDAAAVEGTLAEGETITYHSFNPLTLSIDKVEVTGRGAKTITTADGASVEAQALAVKHPLMNALVYVDAEGRMQRMEATVFNLQLMFKREPSEQAALTGLGGDGPRIDLASASALKPDRPIANPRDLRHLTLRVTGLDALDEVPEGDWQTVEKLDDGAWRVTIHTQPPAAAGPALTDEQLQPYLAPTAYIEADHPDVKAKVQAIFMNGMPEAKAERARRLHAWVNQNIKWQADIAVFRSALDILRDPAGVCRDAATLYTALARAAGVPTRIAAGLVYVNGAFLGHAWAECWLDGRWVPFDPTMPQLDVDATHLKLAEGDDYTSMFKMFPAMAGMTIVVEDLEQG